MNSSHVNNLNSYHSNTWRNNWASNNGWGSYWYNRQPGVSWTGNGTGNYEYLDSTGAPSVTYTWPQNYNLYVDPQASNYRKWPAQYFLNGGTGAAQATPAKPGTKP